MAIKGQNLRIFVAGKCIAAATSCTLNITAQTEDSSTKDSTGDWAENEVIGKSWEVQTESLVVATDPAAASGKSTVDLISLVGTQVALTFDQTSGTNNRTAAGGTLAHSGNALLTNISITAANRQKGTLSCTFTGNGALS